MSNVNDSNGIVIINRGEKQTLQYRSQALPQNATACRQFSLRLEIGKSQQMFGRSIKRSADDKALAHRPILTR